MSEITTAKNTKERSPENPFQYRRPLLDGSTFYGHDALIEEILDLIAGGQSCAIIGGRKLGKSSLLRCFNDPYFLEAYAPELPEPVSVELDFLALHAAEPEQLWGELLAGLRSAATKTVGGSPIDHRASFAEVRREVARITERGSQVVFLCDEMQYAVENPRFDGSIFGALRSLAGGGGVFVITSPLSLLELEQYRDEETRRKVLTSPFFNLFIELELRFFKDYESAELLAGRLDPTSVRFSKADGDFLRKVSGNHPYLLQMAASHLFELRRRTPDSPAETPQNIDYDGLRPRLVREADQLFRSWWRHARPSERRVLRALVGGENPGDSSDLSALEKRGLTWSETGSSPRLASELFAEWIAKQIDTPEEPTTIGRYAVLEEYGYGDVVNFYRAWDERLQRMVAIKVLRDTVRNDSRQRGEVLDKAKKLAALNHPHLAKIHDVDPQGGLVVEELAVGGSLRELLEEQAENITEAQLYSLMEQILDALATVHDAEIVLGDLRAENILFTRPPMPYGPWPRTILTAFGGLRLKVWRQGVASSSLTLLANRAPETLAGEQGGQAADIYSAGTILYELHYRKQLPVGGPMIKTETPSPLERVIERCLEREPRQRFGDARELLEALHRVRKQ